MAIRLFLKTPIFFFRIWWCGKHSDRYSEEERYALLKDATQNANRAGRVHIDVHGLEHIPEQNGFILFPNHQGTFDVLTLFDSCPVPFTFVIKKEAGNLILLKQVIAAAKAQLLDREDVKQAMKVIMNMAQEVKEGRNYLIFAEGTRSENKNEMLDFHAGSFKGAVKAKCPIVPVALIDAYKPFDINSIKPVTVHIHYLEPMYYEEYKDMKTVEIAKVVKQRIKEVISTYE